MTNQWIWAKTDIPPKCKLGPGEKQERVAAATALIRSFYEPDFLRPPPADPQFNYITGFSVRWYGSYLRFTATYACPGPNALAPSFEHHFARLGYFGSRDRYNLWARRHNDEWIVLADELTLEGCFDEMRANPWFHF